MKKNSINYLIGLSLIIALNLVPVYLNAQKVTKLFNKGQIEKAEQYCMKQEGEKNKFVTKS